MKTTKQQKCIFEIQAVYRLPISVLFGKHIRVGRGKKMMLLALWQMASHPKISHFILVLLVTGSKIPSRWRVAVAQTPMKKISFRRVFHLNVEKTQCVRKEESVWFLVSLLRCVNPHGLFSWSLHCWLQAVHLPQQISHWRLLHVCSKPPPTPTPQEKIYCSFCFTKCFDKNLVSSAAVDIERSLHISQDYILYTLRTFIKPGLRGDRSLVM